MPDVNPTSTAADPVTAEMVRLLDDVPHGTKSALARATGVTSASVSQWMYGRSRPGPDKWAAIERYFDLPDGHLAKLAGVVAVPVSRSDGGVAALRHRVELLEQQTADLRDDLTTSTAALRAALNAVEATIGPTDHRAAR